MTPPASGERETYPAAWDAQVAALTASLTLDVAGHVTTVAVTEPQLQHVYLPLLAELDALSHKGRVVAGLAGIPGAGKSTFAVALGAVADRLLGPGAMVVVGMDGWHWPNDVLDRRTTLDGHGRVVPLRQRKGGPESFDVASMAAGLEALRRGDRSVTLPAYDRQRHDPVPDAIAVHTDTRIVLIEGNYLLDDGDLWRPVTHQLRPRFALLCDRALARERIIARHIRGGASRAEAEAKFDANDKLNIQHVLGTLNAANVHISHDPPRIHRSWRR